MLYLIAYIFASLSFSGEVAAMSNMCDEVERTSKCRCDIPEFELGTLNINCSGSDLISVPNTFPQEILSIDLSKNFIASNRINELCTYELHKVSLAGNRITALPDNIFEKCNIIDTLDLSNNEIDILDSGGLKGLQYLSSLVGIEARKFNKDAFTSLTSLQSLSIVLRENTIPRTLFKGLVIERLEMDIRGALEFPSSFLDDLSNTLKFLTISSSTLQWIDYTLLHKLNNLRTFSFSCETVRHISPTLFEHNLKLTSITLAQMKSLPRNIFSNLVDVQSISLRGIKDMPSDLFQGLFSLGTLHVSNCLISKIPDGWLMDLFLLQSLILNENGITELKDEDFKNLHSIKVLDLSGNSLREIRNGVIRELAETVEEIYLNDNILKQIHVGNFEGAEHVKVLNLSNNQINNIPSGSFRDIIQLEILDLKSNKLSKIPTNLFVSNRFLKRLDLSSNILNVIPAGLFNNNTVLADVDLSDNLITNIGPMSNYETLQNLTRVNFKFNPVICDCETADVLSILSKTEVLGECKEPVKGVLIKDFKSDIMCSNNLDRYTSIGVTDLPTFSPDREGGDFSRSDGESTHLTLKPDLQMMKNTTFNTFGTLDQLNYTVRNTSSAVKAFSTLDTSTVTSTMSPLSETVPIFDVTQKPSPKELVPTISDSYPESTKIMTTVSESTTYTLLENATNTDLTLANRHVPTLNLDKANSKEYLTTDAITNDQDIGFTDPKEFPSTVPTYGSTHFSVEVTEQEDLNNKKSSEANNLQSTLEAKTDRPLFPTWHGTNDITKKRFKVTQQTPTDESLPGIHSNDTDVPSFVINDDPVTKESHYIAIASIVGVTVLCILIIGCVVYKRRRRSRYEVSEEEEVQVTVNPPKEVPSIQIEVVDEKDNVKVETYQP